MFLSVMFIGPVIRHHKLVTPDVLKQQDRVATW
jgi:hypothetical protein